MSRGTQPCKFSTLYPTLYHVYILSLSCFRPVLSLLSIFPTKFVSTLFLIRLQRVEFFLDYETTDKQSFEVKPVVRTQSPFEIRQKFVSFQRVKILLFFKNLEKGAPIEPVKLILPVHIDSAKSGLIRQGIENQVDYPPEVANDQRKISELASWLQAPPSRGNKIVFHQPGQEHSHTTGHNHLHHQHHTFTTQATAGTGPLLRNNTTTWPKSAPTSPLSPGSPTDNRIIRSASSSPIRQTVLPNPCCRQKPFNRSASVGQSEPILSSQNASSNHLIDGEPVAKRRPVTSIATLGPIRNGTAFTPISIPDSSQNTFSSIPFERIQESTLLNTSQEVQIGMLPEQITGMRLPTETGQSILITSAPPSNTTTQTGPTKVQHIVVRDTNIKQEYFVDNSSEITTIQTNNANMMSNNNDHIRSQRTGRKCRKVYGVNNRHEWCTACRWKKACRRFPS